MAIEQKRSVGSESSITSIASGCNCECILNQDSESTADVSGVPLKVRKPYAISKQREKWTEEEHQRFIEALKLYGRAWRQIEEYIGTKTAVQIRSHAQKFFSKIMKEGACSAEEGSTEPIKIPPPRPKRKPLHPYPRKLVESPAQSKQSPTIVENGASTNMKVSDREAHSPISVLVSPEGSQISTSHVKVEGNSCVSRTSSASNLSHDVERNTLIKDNPTRVTQKDNEENLSMTLRCSVPLPFDSTLMHDGKILKDNRSTKGEDNYSDNLIKYVGGGAPIRSIKLFGCSVAVADQIEFKDGINDAAIHTVTGNQFTVISYPLVSSKNSSGKRQSEKDSLNGFSCTGSNSNSFNEGKNDETNLDSVDSKLEYSQQPNAHSNNLKRCFCYREAMYIADDRESQRIRVYL